MNFENGNFGDAGSGLGYDKDSMSDNKAKNILIAIVSIIVIFCVLAYFFSIVHVILTNYERQKYNII